ncbi:multidrug ABC transporter ATP-binding protein [Corynebacterium sp. 13CS0277]|uniref:ATP-binding cassette domain-containing protein n=1 Tax=Corynebacterium sp. 13CS0277 TaxID=2071994 RepID=UPI000D043251|nr:ATP-binding cassette domain-containing protein [Corynebacterium sp. 13CS0277]PRQ10704.1 multidrug ABC transporter ATP-binding protein [Corynebacterium sp. 13CS0277]
MSLLLDEITVSYRSTVAVREVSLELSSGIHALLGPNGAGKSSLLEVLATLRKPTSGHFTVDGLSGTAVRRVVGYLPQDNLPKSRFTVREHVAYMCWLKMLDPHAVPAEVDRLIDLADLGGKSDATIASLSGGMRRRVGIASALVGSPRLVLLDEASAGLDMAQRDSLRRILARVSDEAIVLSSTHIVEDIVDLADTITVMSAGSFVFTGPWQDFCGTRTINEVKEHYLRLVGEQA